MAIIFDEAKKVFYLHTENTSYIFGLIEKNPIHIYWGKYLDSVPQPEKSVPHSNRAQALYHNPLRRDLQKDTLPLEFSTFGNTDLRSPQLHIRHCDGSFLCEFEYDSYNILKGKPALEGLPSTYGAEDECETIEIKMFDKVSNITAMLYYSVFEKKDAITRHIKIINNGKNAVSIEKCLSASIDFNSCDFDGVTLCGAVQRERYVNRNPLTYGSSIIESRRGASGHQRNPFYALADKNASENSGNVYAMNLIYSGNFIAGADVDAYDNTRLYMGINPFEFSWLLKSGESFTTPEVTLVYSDKGFGKMSRIFHNLYRENLCRSVWKGAERPIKVNTWETAHFDFNEETLLSLAKKAKEIGVEMLVLDDGWFGERNDDTSSLGDWYVNFEKLPGGLSSLSEKLKDMGMKFGLWVEPEMISENSKLYKKHPDWCIGVSERKQTYGRAQLVLDLSKREVCDYIIEVMTDILKSADITYIKWDMNRNITNAGSLMRGIDSQKEIYHRYILGLYYILDKITSSFPNVLFESCAAGGGRFDGGMLYYMPQTWTSDNTDVCDRAKIQYGTSFVYPALTMSAHVSKAPYLENGRITPLESRCLIAMMGQFGFEFDLNKLSEEELKICAGAVELYKKYRDLIHFGDMYRLYSPFESNMAVWEYVSPDKTRALLIAFNTQCEQNGPFHNIKLEGLDENKIYEDKEKDICMSGRALMQLGINIRNEKEAEVKVFCFEREVNYA